jgi:ribose-phosphate pyrophosphokinase
VSKPNLIIKETDYDSFKYPGGELQVRLRQNIIQNLNDLERSFDRIIVVHRVQNSDDVMKILLLVDALDVCDDIDIDLIIPYLPYSRADRRFVLGDCFGKAVLLNVLKSARVSNIITLDCHSSVFEEDYIDIDVFPIIQKILDANPGANIIFPDEGAKNRYGKILNTDNHKIYFCDKKRDAVTGKFLEFEVPEIENTSVNSYIIDDICDGGGTFLGIAEKLNIPNLRLYVTHGIFSKGFDDLSKYFEKIYTTNSFKDHESSDILEVIDIIDYMVNIEFESVQFTGN